MALSEQVKKELIEYRKGRKFTGSQELCRITGRKDYLKYQKEREIITFTLNSNGYLKFESNYGVDISSTNKKPIAYI